MISLIFVEIVHLSGLSNDEIRTNSDLYNSLHGEEFAFLSTCIEKAESSTSKYFKVNSYCRLPLCWWQNQTIVTSYVNNILFISMFIPLFIIHHIILPVEKCVKLESAVFKTILNSLQCLAACTQSSTRISLIAKNEHMPQLKRYSIIIRWPKARSTEDSTQ